MKKLLHLFTISILFLGMCSSLVAGDKPLTLRECINIAIEKNIQIIQAQINLDIAQSNVKVAFGSFLPNLSASGNWSRTNNITNSPGGKVTYGGYVIDLPPSIDNSTSGRFNTSLNSSVTLFNGFSNTSNLAYAKSNAISSEYSLKRTQQGIILQVYSYYFNVLRTKQLLKNADDQVKASAQQLDKIKESEKLGALSVANVYQQQAQLASDELNQVQAQNNYDKAKADLVAFLTLNVMEEIQFEDSSVKTEIDTVEYTKLKISLENFRSLSDQAFVSRPDYKSTVEGVNAAVASVSATKGGIYPRVSANLSYGLNAADLSSLTDNRSLSWGISISLPIFSNFQTDVQIQQAELNQKLAEEQLKNTERSIQVDIKKAILDLDAAYKSWVSAKKSALFQKESMNIIQEKYNLGSSTLLDLLIAVNNFNSAETAKVNATYSYLTAIKQVEYSLGTLSN